MAKFKIIIAGSRSFDDYDLLEAECDKILSENVSSEYDIEIVSGCAKGADKLGEEYAARRGFDVRQFPAMWNRWRNKPPSEVKVNKAGHKYWTRAGIERNIEMANYADMLIVFWDGNSVGTAHMLSIAERKGLIIRKCIFGRDKPKFEPKMNFTNDWSTLQPLDMESDKLEQVEWLKYYNEEHLKDQVVIHHTVSGEGTSGDLATWRKYTSHIATCVIIERDGTIQQLFPSQFWGYHLGCGKPDLDKHSIAVELDNWGYLTEEEGEYYTVYRNKVDVPTNMYPRGFRGKQIYESYTIEQIRSLGELLLLWHDRYGIPLDYHEDMWDVSERALSGYPGIFGHCSFRPAPDKFDPHPDPNLIDMLKTLSTLT